MFPYQHHIGTINSKAVNISTFKLSSGKQHCNTVFEFLKEEGQYNIIPTKYRMCYASSEECFITVAYLHVLMNLWCLWILIITGSILLQFNEPCDWLSNQPPGILLFQVVSVVHDQNNPWRGKKDLLQFPLCLWEAQVMEECYSSSPQSALLCNHTACTKEYISIHLSGGILPIFMHYWMDPLPLFTPYHSLAKQYQQPSLLHEHENIRALLELWTSQLWLTY